MLLCLILVVVYLKTVSPQIIKDDQINDYDSPFNQKPVPFGHIFRDGIDDPASDYVKPIDLLELHMRFPYNEEEEKHLLRTYPKKKVIKIEPFKPVINPRDLYIEEVLREKNRDEKSNNTNEDKPEWFEFDKIHKQNIEGVLPKQVMKPKYRNLSPNVMVSRDANEAGKSYYFSHDTFDIPSFREDRLTWTTCDEFQKDIGPQNVVYPKDIVNIDWEQFYIWSTRKHLHAIVHRFTYPSKKLVEEYKEAFGKFLPKTLDWEQPKLVLNERIEMLLIAGDRKGLFHGIPKNHIPLSMRHKNITLPTLDIRLKIVDPYLALMYCNEFYATVMGTADTVPRTDEEKREEAAHLKFKGEGYAVSRNIALEKLKIKGLEEQKRLEEAPKIIVALPGYPGIDDIED